MNFRFGSKNFGFIFVLKNLLLENNLKAQSVDKGDVILL